MTQLPRAMTAPELAYIRSDNQFSSLYLCIHKPAQVYTALVNQTFASLDEVVQVAYDTGSGTLGDVLPGMTLWVSAVGYGQCELGQCRIRTAPDATNFYLGENSDIPWADDLYLTVMDEFGIWQRNLTIDTNNIAYMDYNLPYTDQHEKCNPVPILGPRLVPAWLNPALVLHTNILFSDASIIYTGSWSAFATYKQSTTTNDHADFTFTGNRIVFNGVVGSGSGIAGIYLDGILVATVDQYQSGGAVIVDGEYDSGTLAQGTHTIRVLVTGTKNPSSSGYYVSINSFDVYSITPGVIISFDGSLSYVLGDSIAGHSWSFPGSSATTGLATATPTATYIAVGTYRFSDEQTAVNGKITTAYGYVQVFDYESNLPINQFDLTSTIKGARTQGGWSFSVRMYAQADFSSVVDRAMVCLFARDFYGTTEVSIGPITGRENIIAIGWIDGESIVEDPNGSYIDFTVEGIGPWLKKMTGFPMGIQNATVPATAWTSWFNLTVDDSLYHLFFWQSTIIPTVDVFLTNDPRNSAQQYAPGQTTIYDQINYLLKNTILGDACSDRFNRLFCEIDEQLTPPTSRSSIPSVMTLQYYDWRDQLNITRIPVPVTSQVNLSGVAIAYPNNPLAYFSLAPGHDAMRWGSYKAMTSMLLADQASSNQLAAMQLAWDNHQLELSIDLGGNNRMVDIIPHQFVSATIATTDTPRGFYYNGHLIVREVSMSFDQSSKDDSNFLQISWTAENETFPGNSSNGDVPVSNTPSTLGIPSLPALPPLPIINPTPTGAPSVVVMRIYNVVAGYPQVWYTLNANADDPTQVHWMLMDNGILSADHYSEMDFHVSPISGACWLCIDGLNSGTGNLVYCAPTLGSPWKAILTMATAQHLTGSGGNNRVGGLGVNMGAANQVMAVINAGNGTAYWCPGSSGGFSLGSPVNYPGGSGFFEAGIVYGSGQWTAVIGNGFIAYVQWCNGGGGSPGYNINALNTGNAGAVPGMSKAGVDGPVFYITSAYVSTQRNNLVKSTNNGGALADIATAPFPSISNTSVGLASSPDGLTLISAGNPSRISIDGGGSWANLGWLSSANIFYCYGASGLWLGQGIQTVRYSTDAFATIDVDITGDLQTQITGAGGGAWGAFDLIGW